MNIELWIFLSLTAFGLCLYALQILAVKLHLSEKKPHQMAESHPSGEDDLPPVSILKPIKGLDDHLYDNLKSFCELDYPQFELIMCFQDRNDPAYKVALRIQETHPGMDVSIVVEDCQLGLNPKVNNLLSGYRKAKYPLVLISDSNVSVTRNYLKEIVQPMKDRRVGLVTNPIRGVGGKTVGSIMENLHLNSFVMGSVCSLDRFLGKACVVGKSILFRRDQLDALGGLASVRSMLAEDYLLGKLFENAGYEVVLSQFVIDNVNELWDLTRFLNRQTRWAKIRWRLGGPFYLLELIANPVFISLLSVLLTAADTQCVGLFTAVSMVKIIGDTYLGSVIRSNMKFMHYFWCVPKDILIGILWFVPLISHTVTWRGNRYRIGKQTLLSPLRS